MERQVRQYSSTQLDSSRVPRSSFKLRPVQENTGRQQKCAAGVMMSEGTIRSRYRLSSFSKENKSPLSIAHTGFVQRGLPRSSPKNAAAPLYKPGPWLWPLQMAKRVSERATGRAIVFASQPTKPNRFFVITFLNE